MVDIRFILLAAIAVSEFCTLPTNGKSLPPGKAWENLTPDNRTFCPETPETRPPNRVNTTDRIAALRQAMNDVSLTGGAPLDAYIVLLSDEHGTAGLSAYDERVNYLTGFSGSNGFALVTRTQAALWTDGRYFLQGDMQMDCNWILMKSGEPGYPSGPTWLSEVLADGARVGAFKKYVSIDTWQSYDTALSGKNIAFVGVANDLVDLIWTEDRPARPNNPVFIHDISFAGVDWLTKISQVRAKLTEGNADALAVTVLEEVAWLFNLRGTDKEFSIFYAYAIVQANDVSLFLTDYTTLISSQEIRDHLGVDVLGQCNNPPNCANVYEYNSILDHITAIAATGARIWLDPTANRAIYDTAGTDSRIVARSPIALMKSIKNPVEISKFFNSIMRDSAALVEFLAFLENEIEVLGNTWTEITAAAKLETYRSQYPNFKGVSFDTISAVGPHGAIIHYRPEPETDSQITTNELYLLDSGGQYLDGTTDVTRTLHYGTPKDVEKEAYTRVLIGSIELATTVWPEGLYGSDIDARTRAILWQNGWDYNHGTGHGIGYYLSVHEGPGRINMGYNSIYTPLYEGMFFSDEPGYYEDGFYGVRLETLVGIVKVDTPNHFGGKKYIGFRPATLVPFEPRLIQQELLSPSHIDWLNAYNQRCLDEVGTYLLEVRGNQQAYDWLAARTQPIAGGTKKVT